MKGLLGWYDKWVSPQGSDKGKEVTTMARVDANAFIDAWVETFEEGGNQSDVGRKIGTTAANVSTRAKKLRDAGVDLPKLAGSQGGAKLDIESLNARLAERMNAG
jgi:hypothetical protein